MRNSPLRRRSAARVVYFQLVMLFLGLEVLQCPEAPGPRPPLLIQNLLINERNAGRPGATEKSLKMVGDYSFTIRSNKPPTKVPPPKSRVPLYPEHPLQLGGQSGRSSSKITLMFLTIWDIILFGSCIFVAIAIPFEFGVMSWSPDNLTICPIRSCCQFQIAVQVLLISDSGKFNFHGISFVDFAMSRHPDMDSTIFWITVSFTNG